LLQLSRQALQHAAGRQPLPPLDLSTLPARLQQPGASFVTLTMDGQLRGCIGTLEPRLPLAEDVRQQTTAAALYDPRFPPVSPEEVPHISIEISVLSPLRPLIYQGAKDLLSKLQPGVDGVLISDGLRRATFLPQVWEKTPDAETFLAMLCQKAGLAPDHWKRGDLRVFTYRVESFEEEDPAKS